MHEGKVSFILAPILTWFTDGTVTVVSGVVTIPFIALAALLLANPCANVNGTPNGELALPNWLLVIPFTESSIAVVSESLALVLKALISFPNAPSLIE